MKQSSQSRGILYKFALSFVLMSIIPMLYLGYLISNFIMPQVRYDIWLTVEFLIVIGLVFMGAAIVRGLLRSVVEVNEQARKALEGETTEVKVKAEGEVGDLASSLNQIIARIKSETNALEKSQLELGSANAKLLESYSKIQEANEKLKMMDQMKSDFVANVAHELLNPLATIRETMEILRTNLDQKMDAKQREVWEISKRNIVRLIRLVQDILDVSRIEAGKMALNIRPIDAADMLEEILIPLEILFKKKNIALSKKVQSGLTEITADRDKLIQAITNLLMNAAKYTPDGGKVVFSMSSGKDGLLVEVRDSGPGIDVKDQEKLFSKFERIMIDKKEGTGLGLTITKDIISLHKGKIWVESEAGKGAAFKFTLPQ